MCTAFSTSTPSLFLGRKRARSSWPCSKGLWPRPLCTKVLFIARYVTDLAPINLISGEMFHRDLLWARSEAQRLCEALRAVLKPKLQVGVIMLRHQGTTCLRRIGGFHQIPQINLLVLFGSNSTFSSVFALSLPVCFLYIKFNNNIINYKKKKKTWFELIFFRTVWVNLQCSYALM